MNKSDKTYENEEGKKKLAKKKQTVISQECPKCHHPEMYFFTMQMRSADEGTTVFYECVKCGYLIYYFYLVHNFSFLKATKQPKIIKNRYFCLINERKKNCLIKLTVS